MSEIEAYWSRVPCGSRHLDPTWQRFFVQPHIREFAQFDRWKGKRVLEIGCGIGTDTLEFEKAGAYVQAVDASMKSIEIAMKRCRTTQFFVVDAEEYLPTDYFDLIYSFGVLHHTPHPEIILQKANARLNENGELRIMLYAKWSIKHLFGIQPEAQAGCPLVRWYSEREARKLLESCGFRVVSIEKTHIFPWRIADYVQHKFVKCWYYRIMPKRFFEWLEHRLGHHLLLVAVKA